MTSKWHGGKGSKLRPTADRKTFEDNWNQIFATKPKEEHTMTQTNTLPPSIETALVDETASRVALAAWDTLEPLTREIMTVKDPKTVAHVEYSKTVVDLIDKWRTNNG